MLSTISLIYIKNNSGPSIEPWGTPKKSSSSSSSLFNDESAPSGLFIVR